ncbi:acyltransferase family protein [Gordonia sp. PP30]|uniref:acyltransferase family protein n=1 Tax=Gordonia sp. PP30 TaxID=2935861 RepID=UPI001FFECC69|nr:acyltransferase family protein [Gordonia sp. PP30]UQE74712.1 acyltransferase family protein [Gordonia sp. PP30]
MTTLDVDSSSQSTQNDTPTKEMRVPTGLAMVVLDYTDDAARFPGGKPPDDAERGSATDGPPDAEPREETAETTSAETNPRDGRGPGDQAPPSPDDAADPAEQQPHGLGDDQPGAEDAPLGGGHSDAPTRQFRVLVAPEPTGRPEPVEEPAQTAQQRPVANTEETPDPPESAEAPEAPAAPDTTESADAEAVAEESPPAGPSAPDESPAAEQSRPEPPQPEQPQPEQSRPKPPRPDPRGTAPTVPVTRQAPGRAPDPRPAPKRPAPAAQRARPTAPPPHSSRPAPARPPARPAATAAPEPAATTLKPGRIRRAPALDGLRGIAVLSVVVYHLFGTVLRGGYLGVDVFFVLSGFLITSLLVREFGAGGEISLSHFWLRRVRRIVPAAVTVLVVSTAIAGLIGGDVAVQLWPQFTSSMFFVNNWVQIAQSQSYFADTTPRIFMHYWSLAIEEQFYVVWPLLFVALMWLRRRRPVRRRLLFAAVAATVLAFASVALMAWLYQPDADPSRVYFGSETHAFGLLSGVVLALLVTSPASNATDSWPRKLPRRTAQIIGWTLGPLAFAGLIALMFVLPDTAPITYRGGLFAACVLAAAVVYNAVRETGPVPRLLRLPALRWLGERSFSLYLWHWPVMVFVKHWLMGPHSETPLWVAGTIAAVISLVASELSYRWIETPFRRLGFRGVLTALGSNAHRARPAVVAVVTTVAVLLAGSALGTSPAKSQLELQLDHLAEQQKEAQRQADEQAKHPQPPATGLPAGTDVTAVGDSVMLAASASLRKKFPGIYIDAEVSRHYTGGEVVLQDLASSDKIRDYVVLGFGTNGQAFPGQLDRILRMLGPDRKVVLVVPYGPVEGIPQAARQVIAYAPTRKNVFLAPWCSAAAAHPDLLGPDDVHPFGAGTDLYTDAVAQGLKQAVSGERDTSIGCPL